MRGRIYKSLLFMGIISVVVTFILSAILYYQGMQEQISAELGRTARVVSGAISRDREESSIEYLDWIFKDNERAIHIVWLDTDGAVIYDSDHKDEDYMKSGEVKAAFATGSGHEVHKDTKCIRTPLISRRAIMLSKQMTARYSGFQADAW